MPEALRLFETLQKHYTNGLPFVVYSRPINTILKAWLQKNDDLYETESFTESGFVFAPFNLNSSAILFPQTLSDYYEVETGLDFDFNEKINQIPLNHSGKIQHIHLVNKAIDAIKNDQLQKVVLSRITVKDNIYEDPIAIFKRLYFKYKNAMVYCCYHPKVGLWLGATPELLFKVEGRQLTTISLAGTLAVNEKSEPKWTTKEIDEQQVVTDFLAEKVKPYVLSTHISNVETVRAGNLWHLKTRLVSQMAPHNNLKAIIKALHPTPAVCGFPKERAKSFILQNESYNREYYTGFLGELNLKLTKPRNTNSLNVENNAYRVVKTQSNFYVNLRCMQIINGQAKIYVGGGITKDSVAEKEWKETCNKAKTISAVL